MAKSPWQYDFQYILESVWAHFVSLPLTCLSSPSFQTSTSGVVLFFFRTLFFESLCTVSIAKKTHQAELQKRMIHWHREHHYAFLINKYSNLHKMCWQCVHKAEPPQDKWGRRGRCAVKLHLWRAASAGSTLLNVYFVRDVAFSVATTSCKNQMFLVTTFVVFVSIKVHVSRWPPVTFLSRLCPPRFCTTMSLSCVLDQSVPVIHSER